MWGILVALSLDVASAFSDFDVRERTGDYFLSTCTPFEQSYGMRLFEVGRAWAPTVVAPLVLCPLGYAVAGVDKFILSPVWDVVCLPYDVMIEAHPPTTR